jgi:hypothetical protein
MSLYYLQKFLYELNRDEDIQNGQILMHYAAFLGIEWFDYLELMRQGIDRHGPVRAGVYAMTGGGDAFTEEDTHQ